MGPPGAGRVKPKPIKRAVPPKGYKESVFILAQKWKITYTHDEIDDDEALGCSEGWKRQIFISLKNLGDSLIDTLVHEIFHSYLRQMPGFTNGPTLPGDPEEAEECFVVAATTAWLDMIRSNKWIRDLLTHV